MEAPRGQVGHLGEEDRCGGSEQRKEEGDPTGAGVQGTPSFFWGQWGVIAGL